MGWVAIWDIKARAFFYSRSLFPYISDTYYQLTHLEYPLLQPLAATFLYLVLGKSSDMALLITASFYIALAGIVYSNTRRLGATRLMGLLLTLGYAWMPNTLFWGLQFYAETTLLFYVMTSTIYTFTFLRTQHRDWLWLLSLLSGFATQVKVEGIALTLPAVIVVFLKVFATNKQGRHTWLKAFLQIAGTILIFYLPWFLYQRLITTSQGHLTVGNFITISQNLFRLTEIIQVAIIWTLQAQLMDAFIMLFPITGLIMLLNIKRHGQSVGLYLILQVGANLGTYSLFFLVYPQFLSVENFGRYLLLFTNVVYWLFIWQVVEILRSPTTLLQRTLIRIVTLAGIVSLAFSTLADLWPTRFPPATFYARPLGLAQYVWGSTRTLFFQSPIERQQILDARVSGPAYSRLLQIIQATTPITENVALFIAPNNDAYSLLPRSYYLLYPQKLYIVRDSKELTPDFRAEHKISVVLAFDRELNPGEIPGQLIYQVGPRYSVMRFPIPKESLSRLSNFVTAPILFDKDIRLLGYQIIKPLLQSETLVVLYWEATSTTSNSYTVFVHAVAPDGFVRAQHDSLPVLGQLPTSFWEINTVIQDAHPLNLPLASWTDTQVCIGLYQTQTLERLKILTAPAYAATNDQACLALAFAP